MRVALVLLMSCPLVAQQTPAWPTSPAICKVDGQVVDSLTNEAVPGAVVTLYNKHAYRTSDGGIAITDTGIQPSQDQPQDPSLRTSTDAQGRFSFAGLAPGVYTMAAAKVAYLRTPYNAYTPQSGGAIQLEPGKPEAHGLVIRLRPQPMLSGHVRDGDGLPVENATVSLLRYIVGFQGRTLSPVAGAATNAKGEYQIQGVEPDRYFVKVTPEVPSRQDGSRRTYLPVFYPSSPAVASAQQIELTAGQHESDFDFILSQGHQASIRGTILLTGEAGSVSVRAISPEFGYHRCRIGRADNGRFTFEIDGDLTPGSYWLHAAANMAGLEYEDWRLVELGASDISGIELHPAPPVDIHGRVALEGATGAPLSRMQLKLDNSYSVGYHGIPIPVQDDGTFTIKKVPAAVYRVTPIYTAGGYFRAMRLGGVDITESGLDLTHGPLTGDLELLVNPAGGMVRGDVVDEKGNGAAGALVALLPLDRPTDPQRARETSVLTFPNLQGRYLFVGIPPGSYRLLAWKLGVADGQTVLYDPDYLKPFEALARLVQVAPNSRETIQLHAIR